ncbi:hypothetical protein KIPB_012894 [Kipferlia bialata]|uniref:Uncharacterized protein n=1 Tax=Kipferlia bialata TaxID=797122 RepID=A0A391NRV1_9EUKA|nr:hypothetical protein KIPB_012894 [Kipferlia bialata]|eukprot:g12894.t1
MSDKRLPPSFPPSRSASGASSTKSGRSSRAHSRENSGDAREGAVNDGRERERQKLAQALGLRVSAGARSAPNLPKASNGGKDTGGKGRNIGAVQSSQQSQLRDLMSKIAGETHVILEFSLSLPPPPPPHLISLLL